jgi:PAS domain S-box-containing protein
MPVLACTLNAKFEVELVTRSLLDYFGQTLDELKNWPSIGVVHPDDLEAVIAETSHSAETGEPFDFERRWRRYDGVFRRLHARGLPLRNPEGRIERWYVLLIDIEDQKQAEEALRTNERSLNLIVNTIPELAWSTGSDGSVDFLNQRWLDYTGFTADQALGWNWATALHPDDIGGLTEYWKTIMASRTPGEYEARLRRFDGVYRWFLFRAVPVKDQSGNVIKWYGQNIDIEERKRAEDAVRATEQELRAAINAIPTPAWSTRPDGHVDFLNQRWLEYAGLTAEQALGWGWGTSIHPDDRDNLVQQWQLCLASGKGAEAEARHRRFDGVYRWFLVRANPLRDESGNVVKWYGINIDIEDRKRAEDAVRGNEQTLRSTINAIPTTAWSTRPDGYCEFLNQRWLDYAGMTAEQAQGWGWGAAIHPDDVDRLVRYWQSCLASGTPVEVEARMRRFDGVYRWFLFRANPLRDESGKIVKWYGTNIDIEDRKKAEEVSQSNERTLQMIVNTIPALAWSSRPDGYVTFLNQRWLDYAGITAEQGQGWGWTAALHPDEASRLADYWQATLATGQLGEIEARLRRFDGTHRWFLFRATALRDSSGNIAAWYGFNTDIDDRKRAEEQLKRSEAQLAEGQRLSRTGTFAWRPDTSKSIWSEELYRIHEMEPGTPISADIARIGVHPDDIPLVYAAAERGVETGSDYEHTHRIVMPDGRIKFLHVMARATRDLEGRLEYIGAVQDVTQRILSEEALTRSRSEIAHITRVMSLGILTASIAHEVNQPLAGIITNAETCLQMLDDNPPDIEGARQTALRSIRDGNRASDVIARLRSLFKRKESVAESIDLNDATREVIALSSGELRRSRVVLQMDLADDLPPVNGDRVQLQQVIINLLRNAIDAMREIEDRPRQLQIQTEKDGGGNVRLIMQDTGVGFAPYTADRLFESFYSTKDDGMGIGLAISRSIIEAHHGQIWATLNHGQGSTFAFSIPRGSSHS